MVCGLRSEIHHATCFGNSSRGDQNGVKRRPKRGDAGRCYMAFTEVMKNPWPSLTAAKYWAKTSETMACNFITMFKAGPEVSLKGSPTVSPVTAASCAGTFLPLRAASSEKPPLMYFLQLSQAPPELDIEMASCTEETREPVRMPNTACTPKKVPATKGDPITSAPGAIISLSEARVEIEMQRS